MTSKEKAQEIYDYFDMFPLTIASKKECAIYVVDEILKVRPVYPYPDEVDRMDEMKGKGIFYIIRFPEEYWREVKSEIEKM